MCSSDLADSLPAITAEVVETAAQELQWPPYADRVDQQRKAASRAPSEGGVGALLQEQCQKLAVIAARVSKIEELSPALNSIGKTLAAIEIHLRDLAQTRGVQARPDSTANPRQKSG